MIYATLQLSPKDYPYDYLKIEEKKGDRSGFSVVKEGDKIKIYIESKDPTALRASLNHVSKMLIAYEKAKSIKSKKVKN